MKRVQFSINYPRRFLHPLHGHIIEEAPITRAELLMWSPTEDATSLLWCDGDEEATETAIESIDSLLVSNVISETDGTYAFLEQADYEFSTVVLDLISESNVIFLPPVVFLDTGEVTFEAVGKSTALSTFHHELSKLGDPTIEEVRQYERRDSPTHLTDRQQAALEVAVSVGYYDIPRNGTIADIAAVLGCSKSTAGELIRKAESAVIREFAAKGRIRPGN